MGLIADRRRMMNLSDRQRIRALQAFLLMATPDVVQLALYQAERIPRSTHTWADDQVEPA